MISTSDLPALNATFNLVSTIFISTGWYFIRRGAWRRHMVCMIIALALVCLFSDWLHHLSCARWREIFRIYRLDRWGLLSDPCLARSAGVCDAAVSHFDACSGFSSPMGPAQADRALDDPNLAIRIGYRSSRLLNALQMVPSTCALSTIASAVLSGLPGYSQFRRCAGYSAR